jgi:hypothetical protein
VIANDVHLICMRSISALDTESLECREAKEALFCDGDRFVLYLSDGAPSPSRKERIVSLSSREALLWLNDDQTEAGLFWE